MGNSAISANLANLRTARGLSQGQLAARAGLSRQAYHAIESGNVEPRASTLQALADALGVRLEELLEEQPVLTAVRFRADKQLATRKEVLGQTARWLKDYVEVEQLVGEKPVKDLLRRRTASSDPREVAAEARRRLKLKDGELIRDICGLLEDHGIKVLRTPFHTEGFFGLSVASQQGGPAIVVNTWERISVERWIFSAAHELGHLFMHLDAYDVAEADEDPKQEKEADLFAAHFLMPNEVFVREWEQASGLPLVERVFKLKQIFKVSYRTVLYRVEENTGKKDCWQLFDSLYAQKFGKPPARTDEPAKLDSGAFHSPAPAVKRSQEPANISSESFVEDRLARLVRMAHEQGLVSLGRCAEIFRVSIHDMRGIARGWVL